MLSSLVLETGVFHQGPHLLGAEVGIDGQDFIGVGGVDFSGLNGFLVVEGGRYGFDAAAAVDVGFEVEGLHGNEKRTGQARWPRDYNGQN